MLLLRAYISVNSFDVMCLSKTYLNSSISSDDDNTELTRYNLLRADHPTDTKRDVVCIRYRNYLCLEALDVQTLNECINFEIKIARKMCSFTQPLFRYF